MTSKVTYLNNLSAARKAEISAKNKKAMQCDVFGGLGAPWAILADIPNHAKSQWHLYASTGYLAYLDKHGIKMCVSTYSVNDNSRAWANEC